MSGVLDATDPITSKHQRMYLDRLLREALDAEESAKQEDRGVVNVFNSSTLHIITRVNLLERYLLL